MHIDAPPNYTVHPKVIELINAEQWEQRTPAWIERRRTLITASDAAGALSIAPYESFRGDPRTELLKSKVHTTFKGNKFTMHGQMHEDEVRNKLCDIMGERCLDLGLLVHKDEKWLGASPDGITLSGRLIEIKCPYKRTIQPGNIPHHYIPQVQCQMAVCDVDACYFCQWQPAHLSSTGKEVLDIILVQRDREWFDKHKPILYEFWKDVMSLRNTFVPPPPPPCLIRDNLYTTFTHHSAQRTPIDPKDPKELYPPPPYPPP
jgi:putative phage-type endonuclease